MTRTSGDTRCEFELLAACCQLTASSLGKAAGIGCWKLAAPMTNSAEILQSLYLAGFELQTFDRFPRAIGVIKGNCIALLEPYGNGLRVLGQPGWRMGEVLGVLTTKGDEQVFQAKDQIVLVTPERLNEFRAFETELKSLLEPKPN